MVIANLNANVSLAQRALRFAFEQLPASRAQCPTPRGTPSS
jgi:hypothetical protein